MLSDVTVLVEKYKRIVDTGLNPHRDRRHSVPDSKQEKQREGPGRLAARGLQRENSQMIQRKRCNLFIHMDA